MRYIQPNVEWWPQKTVAQQIARVGRICYKTKDKAYPIEMPDDVREHAIEEDASKMCERLWKLGHHSMYRHGTMYYYIQDRRAMPKWIWSAFAMSPYIDYTTKGHQAWISTNMHFLRDHTKMTAILEPYNVSEEEYITHAAEADCTKAFMLIRMTLVVTTQRIQGESYNRKSPNNIAEQSTRYVNLDKKGGVMICRPHWEYNPIANFRLDKDDKPRPFPCLRATTARWASHFGYWVAEKVYQYLLWCGLKPEDARGNLTFNTYTICAYTYNLHEWRHIMDMRLRNLTGKAHPDAHIVAEQISEIINKYIRIYLPDFEI